MIRQAAGLVGRGTAGGDLGVTLGGRLAQLAFAFAANVVCARVLGPDDFGRFGLVIAMVMIAGTLADAGLTFGAIRFVARYGDSDPARARSAAAAYFLMRAATAFLLCGVGILLAEPVASYLLEQPGLAPYIALGMLTLPALWLSSYPGMAMSGLALFTRLSASGVLNACITAAGIVILAVSGTLSLGTLVTWNIVLPLLSSVPAWLMLPADWRPWRLRVSMPSLRPAALDLARFGKWTAASTLGAMVAGQIDLLLMGRLADPASTGAYSVAVTLASRLDVLNQSLFTIMMPRASRFTNRDRLRSYVRRLSRGSIGLAAALAVTALLAQPFILFFYGADYAASIPVFLILLPVVLVDLTTSSLMLATFSTNQTRFMAGAEWIRAIVVTVVSGLLIGPLGGIGAALARLTSRVFVAVFTAWALRHRVLKGERPDELTADEAVVAGTERSSMA